MDWPTYAIIGGAVAAFLLYKKLTVIGAEAARRYLRDGAKVIDVRTPGEFERGHISGAVNIPLGELSGQIERNAPDKNQVLLLHCLSGTRSGMARRILRQRGYRNAFNLGSYGRAARIVGNAK